MIQDTFNCLSFIMGNQQNHTCFGSFQITLQIQYFYQYHARTIFYFLAFFIVPLFVSKNKSNIHNLFHICKNYFYFLAFLPVYITYVSKNMCNILYFSHICKNYFCRYENKFLAYILFFLYRVYAQKYTFCNMPFLPPTRLTTRRK